MCLRLRSLAEFLCAGFGIGLCWSCPPRKHKKRGREVRVPNKPATIFGTITIGNIFTNKVLHVCFKFISPEVHEMVFFLSSILWSFPLSVAWFVSHLCVCVLVKCVFIVFLLSVLKLVLFVVIHHSFAILIVTINSRQRSLSKIHVGKA